MGSVRKDIKFTEELLQKAERQFSWNDEHRQEIKLPGCVCPELGAHALVKLCDVDNEPLGECVVPLTHLLQLDRDSDVNCLHEMVDTNLTLGGRIVGSISGKFTIDCS